MTDHELTQEERRSLGCQCLRLDDVWHHERFCLVPNVEKIVAARLAPVEADRDEVQRDRDIVRHAVNEANARAEKAESGLRIWMTSDPMKEKILAYQERDQIAVIAETAEAEVARLTRQCNGAVALVDEARRRIGRLTAVVEAVAALATDAAAVGGYVKPSALIAALDDREPVTDEGAASVAAREHGLEARYEVRKINDPTGKHAGCRYFVLDPLHDPVAREALVDYALRTPNTMLSEDLWSWLDSLWGAPSEDGARDECFDHVPTPQEADRG